MKTQRDRALDLLARRGPVGATWRELSVDGDRPMGHGSASRVLSDLHRLGQACRLEERRDGSAVYVLPGQDDGRMILGYVVRPPADREDAAVMAASVLGVIERWGLDSSGSPTMQGIASDLRRAVNRPHPDDAPTLGLTT